MRGIKLGVVDQRDDGARDFAQIVRRNVRRHADGDTRRPVDKQIRKARGQHAGLFEPIVVVRRVVDRVLFDIRQHLDGDAHQSRLGVPIRGRVVAFD